MCYGNQARYRLGTVWITPDGETWRLITYQGSTEPEGDVSLPLYAAMNLVGHARTEVSDLPEGSKILWFPKDEEDI